MNKKILKHAEQILKERKLELEISAKLNLNRATENKEFNDIFVNERTLSIEFAKKMANGQTVDRTEIEKLKEQEEKALKKIGLTLDDIFPKYNCQKCNDSGYINGEFCDCLKKEINKLLFAELNRTSPLKTFEDDKIKHKSYEIMKKWCQLNNKYLNVLISGPVGTGKTFLAECVANELIKNNFLVSLTTAINLNNNMLNYHISQNESKYGFIQNYIDADVLIIDDLGTEPMLNNVTKEYLYYILSERINKGKRTVITTNLDLNNIDEKYGDRIGSRLFDKNTSLKVFLDQEDLRLKIIK